MSKKVQKVLVTGANGYIGDAVAKAFNRAGWETYGLIRRAEDALDLARHEIHPIVGSPSSLAWLEKDAHAVFDAVVSNTEDFSNYAGHFADVLAMLREIGRRSLAQGVRPLVMFTSGCKDYGCTARHGDPYLAPHTEESPLNPPELLISRTEMTVRLLDGDHPFDAVVLRPTTVYGYGSSYYGPLLAYAERQGRSHSQGKSQDQSHGSATGILHINSHPNTIMHGTHVDDCAEAYITLAAHPDRSAIKGQAFNISNSKYETVQDIAEAVGRSYGLAVEYHPPDDDDRKKEIKPGTVDAVVAYSQWVSSAKLRKLTGWTEKRPAFAEGLERYRLAYQAAVQAKDRMMRVLALMDAAEVNQQVSKM
ncbi:hypothetical protein VTN77DRAFT_2667 [Rasamsonia byssochlamydoides]|uniref:uncharacterized protein n=1 Tax=Rasamsonia byssochlamydoides TaxID=89139 RepID=UPI0037424097